MADKETKEQTNNEVKDPETLTDLKAQLEAEKANRDRLIAEAVKPFQDQLATLGEAIKAKDVELATHATNAQTLQEKLTTAVGEFRTLVLSSNPLYTQELIAGATIEELKASTGKANALIAAVKENLEKSSLSLAEATVIPAGAPGRQAPNTDNMTTVEKINYGLEQARKKK